jgi:drug/metabolite transporter (DMT)-like permease
VKLRIWGSLLIIYLVWGSTYLAIRFAVERMPPFLMAATRFLVAGTILFVWRLAAGERLPARQEFRSAAVVGLFLLLGGNGCVVWAEQRVPSGITALLIGSTPLWFVVIDALRPGGVRPSWRTIAGLAVGFSGIVLLIGPDQFSSSAPHMDLLGAGVLLMAALLWATGSVYARDARLPKSPLMTSALEMLVGGSALLLTGSLTGEWGRLQLSAISSRSLLGLVYLIIFGSLLAFAVYAWLLKNAPTPLVATYAYVNPLVAIFLGNLLAQEALTLRIILAALIIVSAVALINTSRPTPAKRLSKAVALPIEKTT